MPVPLLANLAARQSGRLLRRPMAGFYSAIDNPLECASFIDISPETKR